MKAQYIPSRREYVVEILRGRRKIEKRSGPYRLWVDEEGNICGMSIASYAERLDKFRKRMGLVRLRGIWKGVRISEEDIKELRREMWRGFGENR